MLRVAVVVGNPRPQSRTRRVAAELAERLFDDSAAVTSVIELADCADEVFAASSDRVGALVAQVAESDVVLFASPTYKASYTGLLKAFLDRYGTDGLAGVVAIPVQTGAGPGHALSPTVTLAPLLMELGAVVPGRGAYVVVGDQGGSERAIDEAAERIAAGIAAVAAVAPSLRAR